MATFKNAVTSIYYVKRILRNMNSMILKFSRNKINRKIKNTKKDLEIIAL